MDGKKAVELIQMERKFLNAIVKDFRPEHSDFRPVEGMMTAAQQIRHIAHTVLWFNEAAFVPGGKFNMDFEAMTKELQKPCTIDSARAELNAAYEKYIASVAPLSEKELNTPLPPNPIMGEVPRVAVIGANGDHTAHHRGSLAVYLRLVGITPRMIYMD